MGFLLLHFIFGKMQAERPAYTSIAFQAQLPSIQTCLNSCLGPTSCPVAPGTSMVWNSAPNLLALSVASFLTVNSISWLFPSKLPQALGPDCKPAPLLHQTGKLDLELLKLVSKPSQST